MQLQCLSNGLILEDMRGNVQMQYLVQQKHHDGSSLRGQAVIIHISILKFLKVFVRNPEAFVWDTPLLSFQKFD